MFTGYLRYCGNEILNSARTEAYVRALTPALDLRCTAPDYFHRAVGDQAYTTPAANDAPWMQAPGGADFCGLWPLIVEGLESSTVEAEVTEHSSQDGGTTGRVRRTTREVRVRALAIAATEEGMSAGLEWLRGVLAGRAYFSSDLLEFFVATPRLADAEPDPVLAVKPLRRRVHKVEVLQGLQVVNRLRTKTAVTATVEFLLVAGNPGVFTEPTEIGRVSGTVATTVTHVECPPPSDGYDRFIFDPQGAGAQRPPAPPSIVPTVVTPPASWRRYTVPMTSAVINRWGRLVPTVRIEVPGASVVRKIRIRFHSGTSTNPSPPCGFIGEYWISFIPANSVMTIDAVNRSVKVVQGGVTRDAAHLVFGTGGGPLMWPDLTGLTSAIMLVDAQVNLGTSAVTLDMSVET